METKTIFMICRCLNFLSAVALIILAVVRFSDSESISITEGIWTFYWMLINILIHFNIHGFTKIV